MSRQPIQSLAIALLVTGIGACGAGASSDIKTACTENTNTPPEACDCLASGAEEHLSEPAQEWLAAAMSGQTELAVKLKDNVPIADLIQASTFMMNYAERCAVPDTALSKIK